MKHLMTWITVIALLAALSVGCGRLDGEEPLRTGSTYGISARIVPAETGVPEAIILIGRKPDPEKRFHQPEELVREEHLSGRRDLREGQACTMCGKGSIQYHSTIEGIWLIAQSVDCPKEGAAVQDHLMRRSDMVQYKCTDCSSGYVVGKTYEAITCRSAQPEN